MPSADLMNVWTGLVQVAIALAGFIVIIVQLRQVKRTMRTNAEGRLAEMGLKVRELVVEHPEIRPYLFDGKEIEPGDEVGQELYNKVCTAAEMLLHYLDNLNKLNDSLDRADVTKWRAFARDVLESCPIGKRIVCERPAWYADELCRIARGELSGAL